MATYGAGNKPSINDAITSMRSRLGGPRAVRRVKPRGTVGGPPLPMGDPTMAGRGGGGTAVMPPQPGGGELGFRELPLGIANKPLMSPPQPSGIGGAGMPAMPSTKPATPSQGGFGGGGVGVMPPSLDNKAGKGDVVSGGKGGGQVTRPGFLDVERGGAPNLAYMQALSQMGGLGDTSATSQPMPLQSPTTNMTSYGGPETSMLPMDPGMGAEVDPNGGLTVGAGLGQPSGGIMDPGQQTPGIMGDAGMGTPPTAPQPFTGRGGNVQSMGQGRFGGAPPTDVLARRQALQQRQRALMGKG